MRRYVSAIWHRKLFKTGQKTQIDGMEISFVPAQSEEMRSKILGNISRAQAELSRSAVHGQLVRSTLPRIICSTERSARVIPGAGMAVVGLDYLARLTSSRLAGQFVYLATLLAGLESDSSKEDCDIGALKRELEFVELTGSDFELVMELRKGLTKVDG